MERLKSIPFMLFFIVYALYVGYTFYEFNFMEAGQVSIHQAQMSSVQAEIDGLKKKLAEGQKFLKSLELKKADIQAQVKRLSEYQGALSEAPDVPNLIKTLVSEAKQIDLKVSRIEPGKKNQKEYYLEQEFKVEVRGSFQQVVLFAQRISKLQRILRVDAYSFRPVQGIIGKSQVSADLSVRAFQYTLSKEDNIGKIVSNTNTNPTPGVKR